MALDFFFLLRFLLILTFLWFLIAVLGIYTSILTFNHVLFIWKVNDIIKLQSWDKNPKDLKSFWTLFFHSSLITSFHDSLHISHNIFYSNFINSLSLSLLWFICSILSVFVFHLLYFSKLIIFTIFFPFIYLLDASFINTMGILNTQNSAFPPIKSKL